MQRLSIAIVLTSMLGIVGCGNNGQNAQLSYLSGGLIGGEAALDTDYPATVKLSSTGGSCTAAKVGSKLFAIAAHCVVDKDDVAVRDTYAPEKPIWVKNKDKTVKLTVEKTLVHDSYFEAIRKLSEANRSTNLSAVYSFDLAFIAVNEETSSIEQGFVDTNKVDVGEKVVVTGYGCEESVGGPRPNPSRLKYGYSKTLNSTALDHSGQYTRSFVERTLAGHFNIITAGPTYDKNSSPGLCPGDSGGPLYRASNKLGVIGVNSYYSFKNSRVPYTNWHASMANAKSWVSTVTALYP